MATIRIKRYEHSFVQMDKQPFENKKLTWQAKGLFAYLMTLPNDWKVNVQDLSTRSKNGRDSTAKILKELILNGYVHKQRVHNEKGQFKGYNYTVYENRKDNPSYTETQNTVNGKPVNGNTVNGKHVTNNNTDTNKPINNNTKQPVSVSSVPLTKEQLRIKQGKENIKQVEFPASVEQKPNLKKWVIHYMEETNKHSPEEYYKPSHLKRTVKQVYKNLS